MACIPIGGNPCLKSPVAQVTCFALHFVPITLFAVGLLSYLNHNHVLALAGLNAISYGWAKALLSLGVITGVLQIALLTCCRGPGIKPVGSRPDEIQRRLIHAFNLFKVPDGTKEGKSIKLTEKHLWVLLGQILQEGEIQESNLKISQEATKAAIRYPTDLRFRPENPNNPVFFNRVPDDIIRREICRTLEGNALGNLARTCKKFHQLISQDTLLKKALLDQQLSTKLILKMLWIGWGGTLGGIGPVIQIWLRPDGSLRAITGIENPVYMFDPEEQKKQDEGRTNYKQYKEMPGAYAYSIFLIDGSKTGFKDALENKEKFVSLRKGTPHEWNVQEKFPDAVEQAAALIEKQMEASVRATMNKHPFDPQKQYPFFQGYPWCHMITYPKDT